MEWLENLLFNPDSIAHIVLLYSLVIPLGVLLGRVRIFGVSLGVTFILFVGILMGHFGFTGNLQIINFVQDFGLILFVFCIGPIGRYRYKMNYFTLMGMIAGTYTDPPALAYANQTAGNDAPALGYTTVYPLAMFLRTITTQVLILILG